MPKNIKTTQRVKPQKPSPDFPLFAHAIGQWAKKIRGKHYYFGSWDDPTSAFEKYLAERGDLQDGRVPRSRQKGMELHELVNHFLTAKQRKLEAGEMKPKTFIDYHTCAGRLIEAFGRRRLVEDLRSEDFGLLRARLVKIRSPIALGAEIQRVRTIFKYGYDASLLEKPTRFGSEFAKPAAKLMRQTRQARGEKLLSPDQIHSLLGIASVPMRGMILLGINAAYGNTDVAELPRKALDLRGGLANFPRPKTAVARRAVLWPETIAALTAAIDQRPQPKAKEDSGLVFVTRWGHRWVKHNGRSATDSVGLQFGKLLRRLDMQCPGKFYLLRHTHRTIADETRDFPAVDLIMGHEDTASMATRYRERIDNDRLRAVTDHVHAWLFG